MGSHTGLNLESPSPPHSLSHTHTSPVNEFSPAHTVFLSINWSPGWTAVILSYFSPALSSISLCRLSLPPHLLFMPIITLTLSWLFHLSFYTQLALDETVSFKINLLSFMPFAPFIPFISPAPLHAYFPQSAIDFKWDSNLKHCSCVCLSMWKVMKS